MHSEHAARHLHRKFHHLSCLMPGFSVRRAVWPLSLHPQLWSRAVCITFPTKVLSISGLSHLSSNTSTSIYRVSTLCQKIFSIWGIHCLGEGGGGMIPYILSSHVSWRRSLLRMVVMVRTVMVVMINNVDSFLETEKK